MAAILSSHSTSTDQTMTYWVSPKGEIILAPDSRMKNPALIGKVGWHSFEAKTAREKDSVAARMASQLYLKKKQMKVEQRMREQATRNMLSTNAKIRLAKSPTAFDAACQQSIISKMAKEDEDFYRELAEEFNPANRTSGLEMEWGDAPTGMAARGDKRVGIAT